MKIIELEIEGFRSFRSQIWRPGDLNLLIGPNASGKSNLLRVLDLLSNAARGSLGRYVQQEGGIDPLLWDGQVDRLRLRLKTTPLAPYTDAEKDALTYLLTVSQLGRSSAFRIEQEMLANFCKVESGELPEPIKLLERDPNHFVVFSTATRRFESTSIPTGTTPPPNQSSSSASGAASTSLSPGEMSDQETLLSIAAGPFGVNPFVTGFQRELIAWKIHQGFHTHREAIIRGPQVARPDFHVSADGQNLISVLHTLYAGNREFKNEINTAMRAAFGEDFEELVFPPAADQRIQLRIRWRSLQREQSAAELSDGTLRFLFLVAVLANPNPAPLIAIDEPETGLHPSMLPIVAEYARDASTRAQVILSTHSPEFLDAFGDDAPTTTVVERCDGQTLLKVLSGKDLSYWLKKYSLGELYRTQELEALP